MKIDNKYALNSGFSLLVFVVACVALVQLIELQTRENIQNNINQIRLDKLNELVADYDNDILAGTTTQTVVLHNITQTLTVYTAKRDKEHIATLIEHIYPRGYSGNITLLSAISPQGHLIGTRAITHGETPGLGDGIDANKSNWILQFNEQPRDILWQLKQDGGQFDALTGATISSRAVILALAELLKWQDQ